jgi:hypothetical protein
VLQRRERGIAVGGEPRTRHTFAEVSRRPSPPVWQVPGDAGCKSAGNGGSERCPAGLQPARLRWRGFLGRRFALPQAVLQRAFSPGACWTRCASVSSAAAGRIPGASLRFAPGCVAAGLQPGRVLDTPCVRLVGCGVADSWGVASLCPRLCCSGPSARARVGHAVRPSRRLWRVGFRGRGFSLPQAVLQRAFSPGTCWTRHGSESSRTTQPEG